MSTPAQNAPRVPRPGVNPWLQSGHSVIHGRGAYARCPIPDGTRVIEYTGERITKAEANRRLVRQRKRGDECVYIFSLNRTHDLDGATQRNVARLINHSCTPNCRADVIRGRIWIVARREIAPGEELTFDYGFPFSEWPQHPCRCGTTRCPGYIVSNYQRWRLRRIPKAQRSRLAALARSRLAPAK